MATIPGFVHTNTWGYPSKPFSIDPLSAPSGFVNHNDSLYAYSRHLWGGDDKRPPMTPDDGPPRKRINRGHSLDPLEVLNSPGSPEVQLPGQRRRIPNGTNGTDALSTSSDDSMPDMQGILSGPSKPRIIRGRRPSPPVDVAHSESDDPKFTRFLVTMPLDSPSRVRMAWHQASGDVKKATQLLSDPNWDPKPPIMTQLPAEATGRVREIDEATKAERAAVREKGKKSMIYANRSALENKPMQPPATPPALKTVTDLTFSSPITPTLAIPRRKRIKKMVVDSESEPELTESDDEKNRDSRHVDSEDSRALAYFNNAGADALQELTGRFCSSFKPLNTPHQFLLQVVLRSKPKPSLSIAHFLLSTT